MLYLCACPRELFNICIYSQHINYNGKDSLKFSFELHYFGPDLRFAQTKTAIPFRSVQNAECRLRTGCKMQIRFKMQSKYKMQTGDRVQNAD